ncbi:MAG: hypothetical protein II493_04145, partial [Spirochaetales bacterium]|nr:hypothetical protein [Spirochaetales bacterium]
MAQTLTIEQAQAYLAENTYGKLRVLIHDPYYGTRNATICNGRSAVMVLSPKSRTRGYHMRWEWVMKVFAPEQDKNPTLKFIKEAKKAGFRNSFIEKCLAADPDKGPYENGLSTGTIIDGRCITTKAVAEEFPYTMELFWQKFKSGQTWQSSRNRWRGYDMTLWVNNVNGDVNAGLSMEYKDCGNGRYYLLI